MKLILSTLALGAAATASAIDLVGDPQQTPAAPVAPVAVPTLVHEAPLVAVGPVPVAELAAAPAPPTILGFAPAAEPVLVAVEVPLLATIPELASAAQDDDFDKSAKQLEKEIKSLRKQLAKMRKELDKGDDRAKAKDMAKAKEKAERRSRREAPEAGARSDRRSTGLRVLRAEPSEEPSEEPQEARRRGQEQRVRGEIARGRGEEARVRREATAVRGAEARARGEQARARGEQARARGEQQRMRLLRVHENEAKALAEDAAGQRREARRSIARVVRPDVKKNEVFVVDRKGNLGKTSKNGRFVVRTAPGGRMGGIGRSSSGDHEVHVEHRVHAEHSEHGEHGATINIHVEEGDVHINAGGAQIHTSKGGSARSGGPSRSLFGMVAPPAPHAPNAPNAPQGNWTSDAPNAPQVWVGRVGGGARGGTSQSGGYMKLEESNKGDKPTIYSWSTSDGESGGSGTRHFTKTIEIGPDGMIVDGKPVDGSHGDFFFSDGDGGAFEGHGSNTFIFDDDSKGNKKIMRFGGPGGGHAIRIDVDEDDDDDEHDGDDDDDDRHKVVTTFGLTLDGDHAAFPGMVLELKNLENLEGMHLNLEELEGMHVNLEGLAANIELQLENIDFDELKMEELHEQIEEALEEAMEEIEVESDGHVIRKRMSFTGDGETFGVDVSPGSEVKYWRVFRSDDDHEGDAKGKRIYRSGDTQRQFYKDDDDDDEAVRDIKKIWNQRLQTPPTRRTVNAPRPDASPFATRASWNPPVVPAASAPVDDELMGLVREIHSEIRAMRAELQELREEVSKAPQRRGGRGRAPSAGSSSR